MGCKNCEERWRIFLATESQKQYIMAKSEKPAEEATEANHFQETSSEAPKQASVPSFSKPDINKVIEDRRKEIQSGKIVKK